MQEKLLSIRWRNAYGNIGSGLCLLVLGLALWFDGADALGLVSALALLGCSASALYASLSRAREAMDEMAVADERAAAALSLKVTLAALGASCAASIPSGSQVRLDVLACLALGLALVVYGVSFACLERG